jgi:hypothetical protein
MEVVDQVQTNSGPLQVSSEAAPRELARDVSDAEISALVEGMNTYGVGVLHDYVNPTDLAELQAHVMAAVKANSGEYTVFSGRDALAETILGRLADSAPFNQMMRKVYESDAGRPAPNQAIYQVLRCLSGASGQRHNYYFHFDSYVVTALLPILIPTEGRRGHLVMAPNLRNVRPFYIFNLIDKLLLDNPLTQRLLKIALERRLIKFKRTEMTPGHLYLFWGYKSLHTNEACDPENVRATALFHYGDPHASSQLRRKMGRVVT